MGILLWAIAGLLVTGLGIASARIERDRRGARAQRLATRHKMELRDIYDRYYISEGIPQSDSQEVWTAIGRYLYVDPERLRPCDRYGIELRQQEDTLTEDEIVDVYDYWKGLRAVGRLMGDVESFRTLGNVMKALKRSVSPGDHFPHGTVGVSAP